MDIIEKNIDNLDIIENIDNIVNIDNIDDIYEADNLDNVIGIENVDCDVINDEIEELKVNKNKHLFFTNIMNMQIININRNKYRSWLNDHCDDLKNVYIKIYYSYFKMNNINIDFNKFTEFCYLYY